MSRIILKYKSTTAQQAAENEDSSGLSGRELGGDVVKVYNLLNFEPLTPMF